MDTLTILLAALAITFADPQAKCTVLTAGERQVIEETNAARSRAGLMTLDVDCRLMTTSRRHALRMSKESRIFHSDEMLVAENVSSGPPHAREAVRVWLDSPDERANILSPTHKKIGVAGFIGKDGRAYWVQQFSP